MTTRNEIINKLASIRQGKIPYPKLLPIDDYYFEYFLVALAELEAIRGNWDTFQLYFKKYITLNNKAWFSFAIPNEHLKLFVLSSIYLKNEKESSTFLKSIIYVFEENKIPFVSILHDAINQLESAKFKNGLWAGFTPSIERISGKSISNIKNEVIKRMPQLLQNEHKNYLEDYILYWLQKEGATTDFIGYYEQSINIKKLLHNTHLLAIKEYAAINNRDLVKSAIIEATKSWSAIEHNQVLPVTLLIDNEIRSFIDTDLAEKIILTPKAN